MTRDNVDTARRIFEITGAAWAHVAAGGRVADAPEVAELWDPEVVLEEVADYPDAATHRGYEGLETWMEGFLVAFDEIHIEPLEFIVAGDCVVVPTHQRFLSKAGLDVEWDITQVYRFRDGRVIHATGYRDKEKALESVGLS